MKLGSHMSAAGGAWKAIERARSIDCQSTQIFVKSNMQWFGKPPKPADAERFRAELAKGDVGTVFGHAGYLINLAGPDGDNRDKSIESLSQEIEFATALGVPFLVLHPGAHLGQGDDRGVKRIAKALDGIFRATKKSPVRIALENTAGQGTCLGHRIRHLADIFERVKQPERLGVCLDTAHFFAAGYDIRTRNGWDAAIAEVEEMIGLEQVLAFHLNDSKTDLNSRVDRHDHIGHGLIGKKAFAHIVNDPRFADTPGCLETPKSPDLHEDVKNLGTLRSLLKRRKRPRKTG
ncbi:MAG: deoxyribonuclease IV [Verrucomicrobiota bacterium]|nr:deoxyribonuclease IV [Verrucomicrobiota bacterium]